MTSALCSLRIDGLLSFGEPTDFEFGRLNLIVGPNGSGKSNLFDSLRVFQSCPTDIQESFSDVGFEGWLNQERDQSDPAELELVTRLPFREAAVRHKVRLGPPFRSAARLEEIIENELALPDHTHPFFFFRSDRGRPVVSAPPTAKGQRKVVRLEPDGYSPDQSILSQLRDAQRYPEITRLSALYNSIKIYSEWSFGRRSVLREATPTDRSDPYISESLEDLALALNALQGTATHDRLRELLSEVKPSYRDYVTRILFGRVGLELKEAPFSRTIPAKRLSDGTLRFLVLAVILLHPNPPPVICIEEPELGMHPDLIRVVAEMITEAAGRTQLLVTTHSEQLISALQDSFDVLFAFDTGTKGSRVRPYTRDQFAQWRGEHSLGELWTSGELGGNRW